MKRTIKKTPLEKRSLSVCSQFPGSPGVSRALRVTGQSFFCKRDSAIGTSSADVSANGKLLILHNSLMAALNCLILGVSSSSAESIKAKGITLLCNRSASARISVSKLVRDIPSLAYFSESSRIMQRGWDFMISRNCRR